MRTVEIYVGTTLRGSAKGVGRGMYIMQSRMPDGRVHEKKAAVEIDGGTESRLVLYCLRCHSSNYLEPFSSVYLDVLSGSDSVLVRLNGGYSA